MRSTKANDDITIGFASATSIGAGSAKPPAPVVKVAPPIVLAPPLSRASTTFLYATNIHGLTSVQERQLLELLSAQGDFKSVTVESYADTYGSARANQKLAERRAQSIVRFLSANGVDKSKINIKAYGEANLFIGTGDGVSEALSRRVVVTFIY